MDIFLKEHAVDFPLPTIHEGLMAGCGGLGIFFWGGGRRLNLSVGMGDLWDHRGGMSWGPEQNFADIRAALEKNDEETINRVFAEKTLPGLRRPTLLPLGRVEVLFPVGWRLERAALDLLTGIVTVDASGKKEQRRVRFALSGSQGRHFACTGLPEKTRVKVIPSYELCPDMAARKIAPPQILRGKKRTGFRQELPADNGAAMTLLRTPEGFCGCCCRLPEKPGASDLPCGDTYSQVARASVNWWKKYWKDIPRIAIADKELLRLYYLGLYKFGCMTDPAALPPGLQGSWIEDFSLPPWQGDYHFNINFQMCLTPGLAAGKFEHVRAAFDLLLSWKELMSRNARFFAGIGDGYMLPHAVDDRCTCMGKFWTGCIDHGCAAWIGHLMFRYCLFAADTAFLKQEVFDFLKRVLNVFYAMMERDEEGKLSLPVSISPEYNASQMDAWGKNASFQLAAVHAVCQDLMESARLLDEQVDPLWLDIEENLPQVTLCSGPAGEEIALWEGQALDVCHRHHSHLAGITPFGTIDPQAPFVDNSDKTWTARGMGEWAGWSFPWASSLRTRLCNPDGAVMLLKLWNMCYTNQAGTSLYMPPFRGMTLTPDYSVMQMDAEMGCVTAVSELFAFCDRKEIRFFQGIPRRFRDVSFENMRLPYGITASGRMRAGKSVSITLVSQMDIDLEAVIAGSAPFTLCLRKGKPVRISKKLISAADKG